MLLKERRILGKLPLIVEFSKIGLSQYITSNCCYIWCLLLYIVFAVIYGIFVVTYGIFCYIYGVCNKASKYGIMLVIIVLVQDLNVRLVKAIIDQIQSHCVISVGYWLYY